MTSEDVQWINSVDQLEALTLGYGVTDQEGAAYSRVDGGWAWHGHGGALADHPVTITSETMVRLYGPFTVSSVPAYANEATADLTSYVTWFEGLPAERQQGIIVEADRLNAQAQDDQQYAMLDDMLGDMLDVPVPPPVRPPHAMDAEQLVEATDLIKGVMLDAHNIPQDQFPGHIAMALSRAGFHR